MRSERSTEFVIGDGGIPTDIAASVDNIILHWQQILVSDTSEEQLKRYFNFQLKRIGTDPDAFSSSSSSDSDPNLIRLIGYLLKYATPYIDFDIIAPDYYITYVLNRQMTRQNLIKERLATKGINPLLRSSVDAYLQNFEKLPVNRFSTYSALNYYEIFIKQFAISTWPDKDLDEWLSAELMNVNFNSLRFLNAIREQLLFETKGMSKNERRHFFFAEKSTIFDLRQI